MRIVTELRGVKVLLDALSPEAHAKAVRNTVDTVARSARKYIIDTTTAKYNITAKQLSKRIYIRRSSPRRAYSSIFIQSRRLNVASFQAKETSRGVEYSVKKGHTELAEGAFIARPRGIDYSKRGQVQPLTGARPLVFERKPLSKNLKYTNNPRTKKIGMRGISYPLSSVKTINTTEMINKEDVHRYIDSQLGPVLMEKVMNILTKPKKKTKTRS